MKSTTRIGTPVNFVGPKSAYIGSAEGRTPGVAPGYSGKTVADQYNGSGIDTRPGYPAGTPYQDKEGNPDEARRVASQHRYGVSPGGGGVDYNDPAANGSGVVFDGCTTANGNMPKSPGSYPDSPVSKDAPWFEGRNIAEENRAHLGQGNTEAAEPSLVKIGGVMGRGRDD